MITKSVAVLDITGHLRGCQLIPLVEEKECVCVCVCVCTCVRVCSVMFDSVTPWTTVPKAPLSMEFSRQEYWSGLPFSTPGGWILYQ